MRRFKLRARFTLVLVLLLLATFTAITAVIIRQTTHALRGSLVNESKSFATLATQPIGSSYVLFHDSGTIRIHQKIDSFTNKDADIDQVGIVDTNGSVLFTYNSDTSVSVTPAEAASVTPSYRYDKSGRLTTIVAPYLEDFGIHRYTIAYNISYSSVDQAVRSIVALILTLSAGILLVSLVVWYVFIDRLFLRPVGRVSHDALLISGGDLERSIHLGRNDEIGDLARAVGTMASSLKADISKLEALDRTKSEFMMLASHNLRTPLTVMKGYLDEIQHAKSDNEVRALVEPIASNVIRLEGFAEEMLIISSMEVGSEAPAKPVAMEPILQRIADEFSAVAAQKHLQFTASVITGAWAAIDPARFHSAIWNLLDNAYKFTAESGTVEMTVIETGSRLGVIVTDTGIGIADKEIAQLFTKFHRGTDTLQYDYEGLGVGLYLTRLIMRQYGGDVTVQSAEGRGSTFTLWLPMVAPEK